MELDILQVDIEVKKPKRGRKSKKEIELMKELSELKEKDEIEPLLLVVENVNVVAPGIKKRGRKPKGGKIIQQIVPLNSNKEKKVNVILHLKCSVKDLTNSEMNDIESFNFSSMQSFELVATASSQIKSKENEKNDDSDYDKTCESDTKELWKKLKQLEHSLHMNNICDKKSACFWCTHDFDNPPIYIPKYHMKDSYHVYGCFCSPECATAFLMEESIDSSVKFERYYLLNHIYSVIYEYNKNIKPAPNPYYMLNKYYGNLTIQEYRSLLRKERLFLVVDKPLTRVLPELHEDNDDFIINKKIIPSNNFQIKKKLQRKHPTKTTIMNENFSLSMVE